MDPRVRPRPPIDNRWQRGSTVDALYLARDEPTMWAEWYRHLAERGIPPHWALPRDVWRFRVPPLSVADLGNEDRLTRVGLPLPAPGRRTWPQYQDVGTMLFREGWRGLVSLSAARPSGIVLCLFIEDPLSLPAEAIPPARTVAEAPVPPTGMRT